MLVRMQRNWVTHTLVMGIQLPYNPAIVFLDIYPRETKSYVHTKTYTQYIKQLYSYNQKLLTTQRSFNAWLVTTCSIFTPWNTSLKWKETHLTNKTIWMNLWEIMLSDKNQSLKVTYCIAPFINHSWHDKVYYRNGEKISDCQEWRRWEGGKQEWQ